MTDFSEQQTDSRSYQYEATVTVGSDGTYRATLDEATDISGRDSTSGQRITDTTDLTTSAEDTTSPRIDAFSIAAPSSQSLRISFDSSERLSTIRVRITGQESTTLSESDFTVTETGSENYTYEATFTINSEGTFTAKLNRASDSSGNNGAVGQEVSITTDTKQNETKTGGIDGFEDGNIDEYSGMTGGFQPQQSVVKNGDWALKGQVQSGDNQHLYREVNFSKPERVQGYIRVEASTDVGGLENAHIQYHSGGSSGDSILHINFFLDSNNDNQSRPRLEINGEKVTENISFSTWYYVELSDIDWETETVGSVTVDDATVAQNVPFENSASTVDTLHLKVNDNNFGNEIAYFDDVSVGEEADESTEEKTEGFEDGNIDEYSGMTGGFQPQQSVVKNGDWALKGQVQSGDNQHLYREVNFSKPERVQGYIRVEASTDVGGLENAHIQYHSGGSSGDSILHINFFLDSNNDNQSRPRLEINGEKVTENISFSTWYYVELSDIDWETETVGSVTVDDATVAQNVPFENSASTVDTLHLKVNDNNFGNEIAYFDDITIF
jgi:hypothetical protein